MAKRVRNDLTGAIWIDGKAFFAGDQLPAGSIVGDHILEQESAPVPQSERKAPVRRSRKKQDDG